VLLSSCYVTGQGYHLVSQQISARPVERVLRTDATAEERLLFQRVAEVREFAETRLDLAVGEAYTVYYRTDRDHLVDVVSAAGEFSFERREWRFPFFGSFPYKGYYRRSGAERLARRLDRRGWDVIIRPVTAFSTLGWFKDPIVTFMGDYDEARLAELVIHEMAHATLWVSGEAQFNEEFATFVGRTGSREFLIAKYGEDHRSVENLDERREDLDRFREDVLVLKAEMAAWYEASASMREEQRREEKRERLRAYQAAFLRDYEDRYHSDRYRFFGTLEVNNAYLDLFETYSGNLSEFQAFHLREGGGELATTIAEIRRRVRAWETSDPAQRGEIIACIQNRVARQEICDTAPAM
jgi:predicted aminopeptidase